MRKALDALKVEILTSSSEIVRNSDETCCAICIDNFEAKDVVRHLTCCHLYHKKCIDPWLMEKGTCPQCKVDILKQLGLRDSEEIARGPSEVGKSSCSWPRQPVYQKQAQRQVFWLKI